MLCDSDCKRIAAHLVDRIAFLQAGGGRGGRSNYTYATGANADGSVPAGGFRQTVKGKLLGIFVEALAGQDALIRIGSGGMPIRVPAGGRFNRDFSSMCYDDRPGNTDVSIAGVADGAVAAVMVDWSAE